MQFNLNIMFYQNIMKFIYPSPGGKIILVMFYDVDKTNEPSKPEMPTYSLLSTIRELEK